MMILNSFGRFRSFVFLLSLTAVFITPVPAQSARRPALPSNLSTYVGKYPVTLIKVASVKSRLRSLLGESYSDFNTSIDVQHQITRDGDFLFASGCMAHSCTTNEAAFVIDLKNKRIHAVIYERDADTRFFNEDKAATPQVLLDWIKEFGATENI
jgi:hypothetical protein